VADAAQESLERGVAVRVAQLAPAPAG
jgi:hypothetical protein